MLVIRGTGLRRAPITLARSRGFSRSAPFLPSAGSGVGPFSGSEALVQSQIEALEELRGINEDIGQSLGEKVEATNERLGVVPPLDRKLTIVDFTSPSTYASVTVPPHKAFTLTPLAYTSEEFFKIEKQRVFGKSWVCVGFTDDLRQAGDTITAEIGGQPVFIVKDKHGNLNGFKNVCRHRGSKLIKNNGRYPVISCPYHRWGYALDGRLLATPMWNSVEGGYKYDKATGELSAPKQKKDNSNSRRRSELTDEEAVREVEKAEEMAANSAPCEQMQQILHAYDTAHIEAFDKKDYGLFKVRVQTFGCYVFATTASEQEVPPLQDYLGDVTDQLKNYPLADLVTVRSVTTQTPIKANWKLLLENFSEYYHLPSVHPALCGVSNVDNHFRRQGSGKNLAFVTQPITSGGTAIDPGILESFPGLAGVENETAWFHALFPNVFHFLLPSHIFSVILDPVSPTTTIERTALLVHPSLMDDLKTQKETEILQKKLDATMDFYQMTNNEDIDACELVQEGLRVEDYEGGRCSYRFEETIHRFHNILVDHLTGHPERIPPGDDKVPYYLSTNQ